MSPEPDVSQLDYGEASEKFGSRKHDAERTTAVKSIDAKQAKEGAAVVPTQMSAPRKQREIRNQTSPTAGLLETIVAPLSPASSSTSTSQTNSADTTFEPTIDMMVNDFDDEQTLNEEEALASLELQDPHDEIATLKEESEMPIEELLAKYQSMPRVPVELPRKKAKKSSKHNKDKRTNGHGHVTSSVQTVEENSQKTCEVTRNDEIRNELASDIIVIESGDEEVSTNADPKASDHNENDKNANSTPAEEIIDNNIPMEKLKQRRSHLLDLYPEESFTSVVGVAEGKAIPLEMFYGEDDEDYDDELDDEEADSDYVKKTIMVGSLYQAAIPDGLSQYGDVLPYENEDKLIWEPSQVSEREVEEYLLKARDIKPNLLDDESTEMTSSDDTESGAVVNTSTGGTIDIESICGAEETTATSLPSNDNSKVAAVQPSSAEGEQGGVIKDNEQALHLLVQCGYDFKEALRRKRLNAVPLTGSMSLWSEEECHKFEEGIQKFGKDFLKIRQNQVRTRSMRELVQFYYLWKKSERRDHDFANADTVDHMDIFLNEGGDYSPNTSAATHTSTVSTASAFSTRKMNTANAQKSFSIMMTGNIMSTSTSPSPQSNTTTAAASSAATKTSINRRRSTNVATVGNLLRNNVGDNQNISTVPAASSTK